MPKTDHHHRLAPPTAIDERSSGVGLHVVAVFEAMKGIVVLLLGLGLLTFLHKDLEEEAENLLTHLHINPEHKLSQAFIIAASKTTDARLWGIAGGAVAYACVRFTEAWGLWKRRVWAEWFALLSGALYLPWEIVKVAEKPNAVHLTVFITNVIIVLYMLYIRVGATRTRDSDKVES
jgi:uncharacterized membrane protein (DUF2068 family)